MKLKNQRAELKRIISSYEKRDDLLLSVIDGDGTIVCANARMVRTMHLRPSADQRTNIFDLVHPANQQGFRTALRHSQADRKPAIMELYLKNGYYHPMKWEINPLSPEAGRPIYLCAGRKLIHDDRIKKFNTLGERNYQLIVEGLNAGILFQDQRGELIAVNQKSAEIFDTTLERLYQLQDIEKLWDAAWEIRKENGERVLFHDTPFMQALHTGQTQSEVLIIRLRSGELKWVHFTSQPLFEENTSVPFSVVSNIADLTNEKKLITELNERTALFRSFMSRTPNMAWVVDEDAKLIFGSKSFFQYFGIDETRSVGQKIMDLVPGPVSKALFDKHMKVLESGQPLELVEKVLWADGTEFVFHINIFQIDGVTGKRMLGGHAVNLAEKFAAEKRLREVNDRLLLLSRATTDAIWEWDMQTGQIFRNDALMDMIGYQQFDDHKGLSWWLRRIHPEDRNRISDTVKEATEKNLQSWEEQYRFKCADGQYKHMRDKGYIVYENGLPVKMIGSLQDITSMKNLESQLIEEKLQRQKEISETVIRVQEMERTKIGHELHDNVNQILSTVKLFVDMMTPAGKQEKQVKEKSLEYIVMAIEEIRKLSKELVAPQLRDKNLVESIQTLIDDIHLSTNLKIRFVHDLENELLTPGIKVTLFRIIQEQLKNIIKHSRAVNVDIWLQNREGDTELTIHDDGIGFDTRQTHRGIGLSNIFERTRFYNGVSEITSAPGKGCTLSISIPNSR